MNGHAGIDTVEATEHLKHILKVGKSEAELGMVKSLSNCSMETVGDSNLELSDLPYQKIELCADKDSSNNAICGNEVDIFSSPLLYGTASNQIIVDDIVDYGWEEKYYHGRLIAFHIGGKYLAYVLKSTNNKASYVRVLKVNTDTRGLIKDYKDEVKDIAFAKIMHNVLLASVDACGEVLIHKVSEASNSVICELILRILRPATWVPSEHNHINWCLYIPDINDDESIELEKASLLVVTHEGRAEMWNINTVVNDHGHMIFFDDATDGAQAISEFDKPITAATFSPDATALAVGTLDGVVEFFQVNVLDKSVSPRCLHHWTPHGEKKLSSIYFLDNHKSHRPEVQFWKFAVTGADNNTELKLWCCETWACLQTIRIHPNPNDCVQPCFKAEMDLTAKYLLLSDIKRKVLLIFLVHQERISNTASIKSVSEFRVKLPVLSLAISSVSTLKRTCGCENSDEEEVEQIEDTADIEESRSKLTMKLFWIQTKTLQSCRITYTPKLESPLQSLGSVSSLSQDSFIGFKDGLSDIDGRDSSNHSNRDLEISLQKGLCIDKLSVSAQSPSLSTLTSHINYSNCAEVLLTPDDFTSPSHTNLTAQNSFTHHEEVKNPVSKGNSATRLSDGIDSLPVEPSTLQRRKSSQHSATSSPSREVAEIMAPSKGLQLDEILLETPNIKVKEDVETLSTSLASFSMSSTPLSSRNKLDFHMKEWPQAPDPSKEYGVSSRNENDVSNQKKGFLSNNETVSMTKFDAESNRALYQFSQKFDEVLAQIGVLQTEIKTLQDHQKQNQINVNLSNKLDQLVSQHVAPSYSRIESLILKSSEENQRRTERELSVISSDLSASLGSGLDNTLKQELANCVLPQINRVLDTVAQKMQLDFSQKLDITDANVKELFNKHLKGKAFVESLAQSISSSLQTIVHSACKEVFQSSVVPAFERSCQDLFHQLNELFQKGTLDYIQILEKNGITSSAMIENTVSQVKEEIHNLTTSSQEAILNHSKQVENRNLELIKQQETLFANLRQIINEEVRKALRSQASVLSSRSVTPAPHNNDPMLQKQLLMQLVKEGNFDEAFQQALSAMDVQLVIYLCENVDTDQVFGDHPCRLQQHVLLSLVNQLSADLSDKTDIKVSYIEEVISCLDGDDPIIKEHSKKVLESLLHRIHNFKYQFPNHKCSRILKRISLAVQALIQH